MGNVAFGCAKFFCGWVNTFKDFKDFIIIYFIYFLIFLTILIFIINMKYLNNRLSTFYQFFYFYFYFFYFIFIFIYIYIKFTYIFNPILTSLYAVYVALQQQLGLSRSRQGLPQVVPSGIILRSRQ